MYKSVCCNKSKDQKRIIKDKDESLLLLNAKMVCNSFLKCWSKVCKNNGTFHLLFSDMFQMPV